MIAIRQVRKRIYRILEYVNQQCKEPGLLNCALCLFHQNMFKVESVNCICVDWKGGSRATYTQATQNVRVVGAEVALLVNVLKVTESGLRRSS